MYSLIMVAALSTGMSAQDCFHLRCWGRSCSCSGCYSSCSCYGCSGCYRSCSGCVGSRSYSRCSCSCSCTSCYGYQGVYCSGCYSSAMSYQCHGCYGCTATCYGSVPVPTQPQVDPTKEAPKGKQTSYYQPSSESARLVVRLPADAKLYVDGQVTRTVGQEIRTYRTPELEFGQDYVYTLKIEVVRQGKTLTESKKVLVRAGKTSEAAFEDVNASVASSQ